MQLHVAVAAQGLSVCELEPQLWIQRIRAYMMRGEAALVLATLPSASLALIPVALEDGVAPRHIPRILEPLPRSAAFPERVLRPAEDGAAFALGPNDLRDRFR